MSMMNILSVTLIVLIVGAGLALFFGMRTAQANAANYPTFVAAPDYEANVAPDTMDAPAVSPVAEDF